MLGVKTQILTRFAPPTPRCDPVQPRFVEVVYWTGHQYEFNVCQLRVLSIRSFRVGDEHTGDGKEHVR